MEIKANQWYRTRGGRIRFTTVIDDSGPEAVRIQGIDEHGRACGWFIDGRWLRNHQSDNDLVEHLPDCTGFDWVPTPKIKLDGLACVTCGRLYP